jgi:protein SCO1/2
VSIAAPPTQKLPAPSNRALPTAIVALLAVGLIALVMWRARAPIENTRVELPVMSHVPDFSFVDQNGNRFDGKTLAGQVWVANFIFTRCPNICPRFTAKMASLQTRSADAEPGLKLVSFTVDPAYDTPEVLKTYGEKYKADFARWTFARGEKHELEKVIREGMLQPMDWGDGQDLNSVVHGSYFALIDGKRQVRGVYKFSEAGSVDEVMRDAKLLLH